ncbi:hypothetical protein SAMN00017405_0405 [Desulfonispora thiosulfatigenes DSM 11270]|uniref:Uncharacterized protein n=1 Tax=Desulfonispora thiosulfatigenes DSM 11270 TaxID=656914 RepID=A0A1W1VQ17_DESTI|nr:hypothetical protein SAMN00017405_0405 [Desulfonispora thiosulfatigenes DSM 11270]
MLSIVEKMNIVKVALYMRLLFLSDNAEIFGKGY